MTYECRRCFVTIYANVLRDKIPEVLPPERFAADGTPIEYIVETADGEKSDDSTSDR